MEESTLYIVAEYYSCPNHRIILREKDQDIYQWAASNALRYLGKEPLYRTISLICRATNLTTLIIRP